MLFTSKFIIEKGSNTDYLGINCEVPIFEIVEQTTEISKNYYPKGFEGKSIFEGGKPLTKDCKHAAWYQLELLQRCVNCDPESSQRFINTEMEQECNGCTKDQTKKEKHNE